MREITVLRLRNALGVSSPDFQTCRIADPPNRPGVKRRSRWVWKPVLPGGQAVRSYSQLELVVSRFLPSVNLARETGNY